eukprot:TRINITY_DN13833_c0_g1_i1.p2 TRINITY_DN13833_c0_g1~~TRINITY_DN13833_c0_g1_i1.p2  ORF type:complete len:352 (-),score=63.44 TRINITY_DN13833_c0_g1_i1:555-1586(-)
MKQVLAILAILGLIAGLNAKTYSIAYYGFDIVVNPSGCDATITETMTYSFSGGSFQGAERSIALNGYSGYPSSVNFISLTSPNTTTTVTSNSVQTDRSGKAWVLQWAFPPSAGKVTFVITYKADVLFTKNKGAQNLFDYVLIGSEWKDFGSFYGGFNNVNVTMTLPNSLKGLSFSPSYTNKYESNGNIIVNWAQSYWSAGSVYDITATFDAANTSCRSADGPGIVGWVIAVIVLACFFVGLSVVVTILRCFCGISNNGVAAATPHADTAEASQNGDDDTEPDEEARENDDGNDPADNTRTISTAARSVGSIKSGSDVVNATSAPVGLSPVNDDVTVALILVGV